MDGSPVTNPFLSGNFAPVRTEDDFQLEVTGEVPPGLHGVLIRNGPNPQFEPLDPKHHWFLGDGMVHGFYIADGAVRYRNRYVRTPKWRLEHAAGRALFSLFKPALADPASLGQDSGTANTNMVWHAGKLLALEEGRLPTEMSAPSLDTLGYCEAYRGGVTAHPKIDPVTGEMLWFAYGVGEKPLSPGMSFGITDRSGEVTRRQDFQAPYCSMVHDFMVSEHHVAFPVLPLTGSLDRAMKGLPPFAWEPEAGAFIGVMRRDADVSDIRWIQTDPCYVYHTANAWEADGKLFCDVLRFASAPLFPKPDGSPGEDVSARLVRWTIDLSGATDATDATDAIGEAVLDDLPCEFPRLDPRFETRAYRHLWMAADPSRSPGFPFRAILHLDLMSGRRTIHELPDGDIASEPVFVPRAPDAPEGDGWILAVVWRSVEDRSDLVILDALDVGKGPIAVAAVPRRVPFGFHGGWAPG